MRLFRQEVFKIVNPLILAVLTVLGVVYFFLFPSFQIEYFSNGENAKATFNLAWDMANRYGTTLEPEERAAFDQYQAELEADFEHRLAYGFQRDTERYQGFVNEGPHPNIDPDWAQAWHEENVQTLAALRDPPFHTYQEFLAYREDYYSACDTMEMEEAELAYPGSYLFNTVLTYTNLYDLQALTSFLESYDRIETTPYSQLESVQTAPQTLRDRILELDAQGRGYLPNSILDTTSDYAQRLALWIVLSVVLLLSPTLVRDRLHRMRPLQWSSRLGREKVLRTQMAAALAASLVLTLANLALYAIPFLLQNPLHFKDFSLFNRYTGGHIPWFDWTLGEYLLVLVGMLLLLGLAAGALTVFLSQYSGNYVAMLLKAVPLFLVVGALFAPWAMRNAFFYRPDANDPNRFLPPGTELLAVLALLVLSLLLCALACWRQRKRELL